MTLEKIKGYISIANKAGYLIVGADHLKGYTKKLFLVLAQKDAGKNLLKIAQNLENETTAEVYYLNDIEELTQIRSCKIIGIKNKGISDEIIKLLRSKNFGK